MKKVFLVIVLIYSGFTAVAQNPTRVEIPVELYRNQLRDGQLPPDLEGSPYDHEEFIAGTVTVKDSDPVPAMLRYDVYRDNIEMQEGESTVSLLKRDYIIATINQDKFVIAKYMPKNEDVRQGYLIQLNDGPIKLLKRKSKRFLPATETFSTYKAEKPPRFLDQTDYYLLSGEEYAEDIKLRKKNILNAMDNASDASKIVKELDLDLSEENDVIRLLNMLNNNDAM